jgi:putative copper export protein
MDALLVLKILKVIHVLSASLWIGSIVSLSLAVRVIRSVVGDPHSVTISAEMGRRLRTLTRTSLYMTLASGILLIYKKGFLSGLLSIDIVFLKIVIGVSLLLLVWYHESLGSLLSRIKDANSLPKVRRRMIIVGWLTVALSVILAVLGTVLRFG